MSLRRDVTSRGRQYHTQNRRKAPLPLLVTRAPGGLGGARPLRIPPALPRKFGGAPETGRNQPFASALGRHSGRVSRRWGKGARMATPRMQVNGRARPYAGGGTAETPLKTGGAWPGRTTGWKPRAGSPGNAIPESCRRRQEKLPATAENATLFAARERVPERPRFPLSNHFCTILANSRKFARFFSPLRRAEARRRGEENRANSRGFVRIVQKWFERGKRGPSGTRSRAAKSVAFSAAVGRFSGRPAPGLGNCVFRRPSPRFRAGGSGGPGTPVFCGVSTVPPPPRRAVGGSPRAAAGAHRAAGSAHRGP